MTATILLKRSMVAVIGGLVLSLAIGCGPAPVPEAGDIAGLQQLIKKTSQPVLVDYYKQGCEHCNAFEITLRLLASEHKGQIVTTKFLLMKANGECTAPEFATKHDIQLYPTVVMYVNGKEVKRFVQDYMYDDYSKAIDECVKSSAGPPKPAAGQKP